MENESRTIVLQRKGNVLSRGTILKLDQYLKIQDNIQYGVVLSGAPNFRQAQDLPIYGVGQPTVFGIQTVLNHIKKNNKGQQNINVQWINMREEPIIYINKRPFVLREIDRPLKNLSSYAGIQVSVIEEMEQRLKQDILLESKNYEGNILIHDEVSNSGIVGCWEAIGTVQTPREVYSEFNSTLISVNYLRMTFTPEKAPTPQLFDQLRECLLSSHPHTHIVFNCHMGKGRSTTGMVIASLIVVLRDFKIARKMIDELSPKPGSFIYQETPNDQHSSYKPISTLIKILTDGREIKKIVDSQIDKCASSLNLRQIIFDHLHNYEHNGLESEFYLSSVANSMARYLTLLSFASYLAESSETHKYSEWIETRPEITYILSELLKNPEKSLIKHEARSLRLSTRTSSVMTFRNGTLLTNQMIIKLDHPQSSALQPTIEQFRKTPGFDIYSLGSFDFNTITHILSSIRNKPSDPVVWISLREEMCIHINRKAYVIRDSLHPFHNYEISPEINSEKLEGLEHRLKAELVTEASFFEGKILVHDEINRNMTPLWEEINSDSFQTTLELFEEIKQNDPNLTYYRIPVSSGKNFTENQYQRILEIILNSKKNAKVIFSSQTGSSGRSTTGQVITYLIKISTREFLEDLNVPIKTYDYKCILNLQRILKQGHFLKLRVDRAIFLCGKVYNLIEKINEMRGKYLAARNKEELQLFVEKIEAFLERYFYLIVFCGFLYERDQHPDKTFLQWTKELPELNTVLEEMRKNPENSFLMEEEFVALDPNKVIRSRSGNVLTSGTLLKNDHFPGCQRTSLQPQISGAPNFRKVEGVNVYGTGIPTIEGVKNILIYLNCTPETRQPILWINLREEPIIYINNKPYVLRNIYALFANLEYTGIDPRRVEEMEERLKEDVLKEAIRFGGKILVHDETPDMKLFEEWQRITSQDVLTTRNGYERLIAQGYPVQYVKVAITDEQSPDIREFESIINLIKDKNPLQHKFIFNCQMGRGRTTTGIVIATLFFKWKSGELNQLLKVYSETSPIATNQDDQDENLLYLRGEYQLILRQVRVLQNGIAIKRILDDIIDICSHMQNLRADINTYRLKSQSSQENEKHKEAAFERGINYLKRYFFLIAFTAHLLEENPQVNANFQVNFRKWLEEHQELHSLLQNVDLF